MPKLTEKDICDKWLKNKTINPETSRKIKENGTVYKKLLKKCSLNPLNQKEICDKWLKNKTVNPETLRKIKENGTIYKKLAKKCLVKSDKSSEISSINKMDISPPKKSIVNSETKKINAAKKIHKLFLPYVKRTSVNIIDRINYFIIMKKYILSIKEKNNCLRLYNYDKKNKEITYRIGRNIILDKQIGTKSVYGIVFLSHFKTNIKYGTKFDKLNKFAVKITSQSKDNKTEIKVLEDLTKLVINLTCPHFPINYGSLKCNNSNIKSDNSDDYSIVKDKHKDKNLLPYFVVNKNILIQINELASGDLHSLLMQFQKTNIYNILTNILISLMFFHKYTNCYHGDPHSGNFLYHKIKPGGYFHYNIYGKDYYLENIGYLWVVWDFGLIKPFTENNKYGKTEYNVPINFDYIYILDTINYYIRSFTPEEQITIKTLRKSIIQKYDKIPDYNLFKYMNKEILNFLLDNVSSFTNIKPSNVINKNPYIIR
jgi:hypothetical protein